MPLLLLVLACGSLFLPSVMQGHGSQLQRESPLPMQIIGTGQSLSVHLDNVAENATAITGTPFTLQKFGVGSTPYSGLKAGTQPFIDSVAAGGDYISVVHGESDSGNGVGLGYEAFLNEWQADYGAALGKPNIPLVTGQMSSMPRLVSGVCQVSPVALAQFNAARNNPNIYMVGPKYQYRYDASEIHLLPDHYRWLGAQHGKVIGTLANGDDWRPLMPISVTLSGKIITAKMHVPVGPIQMDTTTVPLQGSLGFEYYDDAGPSAQIASVMAAGDTVYIVLNDLPAGGDRRLRYAFGAEPCANLQMKGNIKDSDTTPLVGGYDAANWLVHFDEPITDAIQQPITATTDIHCQH